MGLKVRLNKLCDSEVQVQTTMDVKQCDCLKHYLCIGYSPKAKKTKMHNVKLQNKWGRNKERGCVNFLVTKVASTKVPSLSKEVT
jgi:hypothetical protein